MTHELDDNGELVHVDIDPFIPTGFCAVCTGHDQETKPPEERGNDDQF